MLRPPWHLTCIHIVWTGTFSPTNICQDRVASRVRHVAGRVHHTDTDFVSHRHVAAACDLPYSSVETPGPVRVRGSISRSRRRWLTSKSSHAVLGLAWRSEPPFPLTGRRHPAAGQRCGHSQGRIQGGGGGGQPGHAPPQDVSALAAAEYGWPPRARTRCLASRGLGWRSEPPFPLTGRRHPATERLRVRAAITVEGIGTAVKDADTVCLLMPVGEHVGCHDTVAQQLEGRTDALTRLRWKREGEACKALQWSYSDDTMYWMKIFPSTALSFIYNLQHHILQVSITLCYKIKNKNANDIFIQNQSHSLCTKTSRHRKIVQCLKTALLISSKGYGKKQRLKKDELALYLNMLRCSSIEGMFLLDSFSDYPCDICQGSWVKLQILLAVRRDEMKRANTSVTI